MSSFFVPRAASPAFCRGRPRHGGRSRPARSREHPRPPACCRTFATTSATLRHRRVDGQRQRQQFQLRARSLRRITPLDALIAIPVACAAPIWADELPRRRSLPARLLSALLTRILRDTSPTTTAPTPSLVRAGGRRYGNNFDGINSVGGHFLLDTTYRFGLEASGSQLEEQLPGGGRDRLAIGDVNLVFRFSPSARGPSSRAGARRLDGGPAKDRFRLQFHLCRRFLSGEAWIISTAFDAGTLGHAALLRFRLTGGVVFHQRRGLRRLRESDIGRTEYQQPGDRPAVLVLTPSTFRLAGWGLGSWVFQRALSNRPDSPFAGLAHLPHVATFTTLALVFLISTG